MNPPNTPTPRSTLGLAPASSRPALDFVNSHVVHFKALVCYILDPAQPPCFTGEYNPVRISRELLRVLRDHKHFDTFCFVDERPDGYYLWLRQNYVSTYAHWNAQRKNSDAQRVEMLTEDLRMRRAIENYINWQRACQSRTGRDTLVFLISNMIEDWRINGEHCTFLDILKRVEYLDADGNPTEVTQ